MYKKQMSKIIFEVWGSINAGVESRTMSLKE